MQQNLKYVPIDSRIYFEGLKADPDEDTAKKLIPGDERGIIEMAIECVRDGACASVRLTAYSRGRGPECEGGPEFDPEAVAHYYDLDRWNRDSQTVVLEREPFDHRKVRIRIDGSDRRIGREKAYRALIGERVGA